MQNKNNKLRKIEIKNQQLLSYNYLYNFVIKFAKPIFKINVIKFEEITFSTQLVWNVTYFGIWVVKTKYIVLFFGIILHQKS